MPQVNCLILAGLGLNCEDETAQAFELCGAKVQLRHVNDLIAAPKQLQQFQIFVIPGGFSFGDQLGAGLALARKLEHKLLPELRKFSQAEKLILGICNGFQVLLNLGIFSGFQPEAALLTNAFPRYLCQSVSLRVTSKQCVWLKNLTNLDLPLASGEGRFYAPPQVLQKIQRQHQIALQYVDNPNGSVADIAGICDPTGRILGLMPHPERNFWFHQRPDFCFQKEKFLRLKQSCPQFSIGKKIFENAITFFE